MCFQLSRQVQQWNVPPYSGSESPGPPFRWWGKQKGIETCILLLPPYFEMAITSEPVARFRSVKTQSAWPPPLNRKDYKSERYTTQGRLYSMPFLGVYFTSVVAKRWALRHDKGQNGRESGA